jgi:hypothetical protein
MCTFRLWEGFFGDVHRKCLSSFLCQFQWHHEDAVYANLQIHLDVSKEKRDLTESQYVHTN